MTEETGTLAIGEVHPSTQIALLFIKKMLKDNKELFLIQESLASCALSGNRIAEICHETLRRILMHEPVSDRYLMGLAWFLYDWNQNSKYDSDVSGGFFGRGD